ncbi:fumarylacetoacetate hydrolase family protein [Saliphagus sp. LR7]|uniref:fumarylacetoacetate hydrolase family protein n=1 Tax=Saliphagus sp. LR7 TaxID=2282654 RepID=UPI000DF737A7|nr:fumarylacetoacetate hydrolase family protein [Saliphagus sp. LR7]
MRYARFRDRAGSVRVGEWTDDGIEFGDRTYELEEVDVLPPVEPTKIVCLAANYIEHMKEGDGEVNIPDAPTVFLKGPNAVAGHEDTVALPEPRTAPEDLPDEWGIELGDRVDYEAELGVVIGKQCRNVSQDGVDNVIDGYTCLNDISNRDDQSVFGLDIRGKAFDNSTPIGPVVATPEHVEEDPRIRLWLNGEQRQDSTDDEMIFSVREAIEEITKFITLEEGDVVAMGTTYGIGRLSDGDTVEIEIDGIGRLKHYVERPSSDE